MCSGTTVVCETDVLLTGSMKQRGWMPSAVEMEMVEMVQQGRKGFDTILKRASQISLTWDCILMESVKLSSMDNTPEISLYGSHSFLFFTFPRFLFFIFPIIALEGLQHLSFFIVLLTLQTALQHSRSRIMPPPHLCVHTTPCPSKVWYPLQRPPWNILALVLLHSVFNHNPTDYSLTSCSGYISLSVLCKHCAHIQVCTWSATFCVYTSGDRGMPAV